MKYQGKGGKFKLGSLHRWHLSTEPKDVNCMQFVKIGFAEISSGGGS